MSIRRRKETNSEQEEIRLQKRKVLEEEGEREPERRIRRESSCKSFRVSIRRRKETNSEQEEIRLQKRKVLEEEGEIETERGIRRESSCKSFRVSTSMRKETNECLDWQYNQFINIVGKDDFTPTGS